MEVFLLYDLTTKDHMGNFINRRTERFFLFCFFKLFGEIPVQRLLFFTSQIFRCIHLHVFLGFFFLKVRKSKEF